MISFVILGFFIFVIFFMLSEPLTTPEVGKRYAKMGVTVLLLISAFGLFLVTSPFAIPRGEPGPDDPKRTAVTRDWHPTLPGAMVVAKKEGSRVLIDFWAEWCTACHEMEEQLFSTPEFRALVKQNKIVLARLDFTKETDENQTIAEKYGIMGLPTLILTDSKGELIDSIIGFQNVELALKLLKQAMKKPYATGSSHEG